MADRFGSATVVTIIRVAATATTLVVNLYPLVPLAMARWGAAKLKE
jgi:hypothetical protein